MFTKKHSIAGCGALALVLCSGVASAQTTVAYWDFDNGAAGTAFSVTPATDSSGNNYSMLGFDPTWGPSYSADTVSGSGLSSRHVGQDGYTVDAGINNWAPQQWTIELSVKLDTLSGWKTIIGRDGTTDPAGFESTFYFQNNGIDDRFRLNFYTTGGQRYIIDSNFVPLAGEWYHVAMTSDGATASMYVDQLDGNGYQLAGSAALTGVDAAANALASSGGLWTFGRGWFNGGFVDAITGNLDDIRFTDGTLAPSQFLHATAVPEPSTAAALAGVLVLGLGCARRRRGATRG